MSGRLNLVHKQLPPLVWRLLACLTPGIYGPIGENDSGRVCVQVSLVELLLLLGYSHSGGHVPEVLACLLECFVSVQPRLFPLETAVPTSEVERLLRAALLVPWHLARHFFCIRSDIQTIGVCQSENALDK